MTLKELTHVRAVAWDAGIPFKSIRIGYYVHVAVIAELQFHTLEEALARLQELQPKPKRRRKASS